MTDPSFVCDEQDRIDAELERREPPFPDPPFNECRECDDLYLCQRLGYAESLNECSPLMEDMPLRPLPNYPEVPPAPLCHISSTRLLRLTEEQQEARLTIQDKLLSGEASGMCLFLAL